MSKRVTPECALPSGRPAAPERQNHPAPENTLDSADCRLLDIIQTGFPLETRPYARLGEELGLPEAEVLARVRGLKERGFIRRLGANFDSRRLGWRSTLCGAKVPQDKLEAFIAEVNRLPGVTHNYLRDHAYNVWFTLIAPSEDDITATLQELTRRTGVTPLNLPARKTYKLKVDFEISPGD